MKRWSILAAGFLALASQAKADETDDILDRASAAFAAKNYDQAAELFGTAADRYEQSHGDGTVYCARNNDQKFYYSAIGQDSGEDVTVLDEGWCTALYLEAYSLIELGRIDEALPLLAKAVELSPLDGQFSNEFGYVLAQSGYLDDALTIYRRVMELADADVMGDQTDRYRAVALRGIGWVLAERKEWDEAEDSYRRSLLIEPDNETALSELDYIATNRPHD